MSYALRESAAHQQVTGLANGDAAAPAAPVAVPAEMGAVLSGVLGRIDPTVKRIMRHALERAGGAERLSVEHLFRSLMAVDCGFVFRKLRRIRVPLQAAIKASHLGAADRQSVDPAALLTVLQSAGKLAAAGVPINSQHLLVAILLEGTNGVAQQVREAGVDLPRLLIANFTCLPHVRDVARQVTAAPYRVATPPALGAALAHALEFDFAPAARRRHGQPRHHRCAPQVAAPRLRRRSPAVYRPRCPPAPQLSFIR